LRETSRLKSCFNPNPTIFLENHDPRRENIVDRTDVILNLVEKSKILKHSRRRISIQILKIEPNGGYNFEQAPRNGRERSL
jgi:hypothetical protein